MSTHSPKNPANIKPRSNGLFILGGSTSLALSILFAIGITVFFTPDSQLAPLPNNWLIVLFRLNIPDSSSQTSMLNILNPLDLILIALFCILFIPLNTALRHTHKIWSAIATSLPYLGALLFLITHTAGRSALLIGVLIFSIIMLGSNNFSKKSALIGVASSVLLFFAGDIGTTLFPPSIIIAILIGIGYLLWVLWFALIGWSFFQLYKSNKL